MPPKINLLKPKGKIVKVGKHSSTKVHLIRKRKSYKPIAYTRSLSENSLKIMEKLNKAGIKTEKILNLRKDNGIYRVQFLAEGENIERTINTTKPEKRKKLLEKAADFLAAVHNLGIAHYHPHLRNFVVNKRGQVFLIQYNLAVNVQIDENEKVLSRYNAFRNDFLAFYRESPSLNAKEKNDFIRRVISNYPLSDYEKRKLTNMVLTFIDDTINATY